MQKDKPPKEYPVLEVSQPAAPEPSPEQRALSLGEQRENQPEPTLNPEEPRETFALMLEKGRPELRGIYDERLNILTQMRDLKFDADSEGARLKVKKLADTIEGYAVGDKKEELETAAERFCKLIEDLRAEAGPMEAQGLEALKVIDAELKALEEKQAGGGKVATSAYEKLEKQRKIVSAPTLGAKYVWLAMKTLFQEAYVLVLLVEVRTRRDRSWNRQHVRLLSDRPANTRCERAVGVRREERLAQPARVGDAAAGHEGFDAEDERFDAETRAGELALEHVEGAQRPRTVARGERATCRVEGAHLVGERRLWRRDDRSDGRGRGGGRLFEARPFGSFGAGRGHDDRRGRGVGARALDRRRDFVNVVAFFARAARLGRHGGGDRRRGGGRRGDDRTRCRSRGRVEQLCARDEAGGRDRAAQHERADHLDDGNAGHEACRDWRCRGRRDGQDRRRSCGRGDCGRDWNLGRLGRGSIVVNGNLPIQELEEILEEASLPEGDYNTAAGIALHVLRRMPQRGDVLAFANWQVSVTAMEGRRVSRLTFRKNAEPHHG